ncbi:hypothetical protein [Neisseria sp.]|uniref:hypothetical protein n=1 Tax=Neisseria sp. TaxID=192066 RepID=UPI0035A05DAD
MLHNNLLLKIANEDYRRLIETNARRFSIPEVDLLHEILETFEFDVVQAQALAQAAMLQAKFDPDALHIETDDDEDVTGVCPHCINPPMPPLRDYMVWRQTRG